jgi:hypothetical protein
MTNGTNEETVNEPLALVSLDKPAKDKSRKYWLRGIPYEHSFCSANGAPVLADERIVSADSHIMEPADLWEKSNAGPSENFPSFHA